MDFDDWILIPLSILGLADFFTCVLLFYILEFNSIIFVLLVSVSFTLILFIGMSYDIFEGDIDYWWVILLLTLLITGTSLYLSLIFPTSTILIGIAALYVLNLILSICSSLFYWNWAKNLNLILGIGNFFACLGLFLTLEIELLPFIGVSSLSLGLILIPINFLKLKNGYILIIFFILIGVGMIILAILFPNLPILFGIIVIFIINIALVICFDIFDWKDWLIFPILIFGCVDFYLCIQLFLTFNILSLIFIGSLILILCVLIIVNSFLFCDFGVILRISCLILGIIGILFFLHIFVSFHYIILIGIISFYIINFVLVLSYKKLEWEFDRLLIISILSFGIIDFLACIFLFYILEIGLFNFIGATLVSLGLIILSNTFLFEENVKKLRISCLILVNIGILSLLQIFISAFYSILIAVLNILIYVGIGVTLFLRKRREKTNIWLDTKPKDAEDAYKHISIFDHHYKNAFDTNKYKQAIDYIKKQEPHYTCLIEELITMDMDSLLLITKNEWKEKQKTIYNCRVKEWEIKYDKKSKEYEKSQGKKNIVEMLQNLQDVIDLLSNRFNLAKKWNSSDEKQIDILLNKCYDHRTYLQWFIKLENLENNFNSITKNLKTKNLISIVKPINNLLEQISKIINEIEIKNLPERMGIKNMINSFSNQVKNIKNQVESDLIKYRDGKISSSDYSNIYINHIAMLLPNLSLLKFNIKNIKEQKVFAKIVLLGESSVGKTHIVHSITKNAFSSKDGSTRGVKKHFISVNIGDSSIQSFLSFWDFGGQIHFQSLNQLFLHDSNAVLLVFDITRPETFIRLSNWIYLLRKSRNFNPQSIILVGNKTDLGDFVISEEDINIFMEKYNIIHFIKTSALNKSNIDEIIPTLVNLVDWSVLLASYNVNLFKKVEDLIIKLRKDKKIYKTNNLIKVLSKYTQVSTTVVQAILNQSVSQNIIQFGSNKSIVILDPEFISEMLFAIIIFANKNKGKVSIDEIFKIWSVKKIDHIQIELIMNHLVEEHKCYKLMTNTWVFPGSKREKPPELTDNQRSVVNSNQISQNYKFEGSPYEVFFDLLILSINEIGIPSFESFDYAIWELGNLQNRTVIIMQLIADEKGGIIRLIAGGVHAQKEITNIYDRLKTIFSLISTDFTISLQ